MEADLLDSPMKSLSRFFLHGLANDDASLLNNIKSNGRMLPSPSPSSPYDRYRGIVQRSH